MMMEILPDNKWKYYLFATLSIIGLSTIGACIYRKNKNKGVVKNDTKNQYCKSCKSRIYKKSHLDNATYDQFTVFNHGFNPDAHNMFFEKSSLAYYGIKQGFK